MTNKQLLALLGFKDEHAGAVLGSRPSARLRIIGQSGGPRPVPRPDENRRRSPRLSPADTHWAEEALLRPGTAVRVVDIARAGALLESPTRLHLDVGMELLLTPADKPSRVLVSGRILRCTVANLSPLTFHAAMAFDTELDELAVVEAGGDEELVHSFVRSRRADAADS